MGHLVTDRNEEERHNTLSQFFIIKIKSWSTGLSRTIAGFLTINLTYRASLLRSPLFLLFSFFYVCCSLFCAIFLKLLKPQIAISRATRISVASQDLPNSIMNVCMCVCVRRDSFVQEICFVLLRFSHQTMRAFFLTPKFKLFNYKMCVKPRHYYLLFVSKSTPTFHHLLQRNVTWCGSVL